MRPVISLFALLFALTVTAATARNADAQSAPTPVVTGTLRAPSTNAAWGTWEGFETSSNVFGFWLRFRPSNGHVYTVVPFEMTADGKLACWYIEYWVVGASDPNRSEGWQWQEVAGGRVLLDPATATSSSIDGSIAQTYVMIGYSRQQETNVNFVPLRLSVP
jgi:hypothetical protein